MKPVLDAVAEGDPDFNIDDLVDRIVAAHPGTDRHQVLTQLDNGRVGDIADLVGCVILTAWQTDGEGLGLLVAQLDDPAMTLAHASLADASKKPGEVRVLTVHAMKSADEPMAPGYFEIWDVTDVPMDDGLRTIGEDAIRRGFQAVVPLDDEGE